MSRYIRSSYIVTLHIIWWTQLWKKFITFYSSHWISHLLGYLYLIIFSISVKDPIDYQGRSFLHAPHDVGTNLRSDTPPDRCFLPKTQIHTWEGHTKGISAIRWFPKTAHLLLSCSMDCRVKVLNCFHSKLNCFQLYETGLCFIKLLYYNTFNTDFINWKLEV